MNLPKGLPSPIEMKKAEITELLQREEYGYLPPAPIKMSTSIEEEANYHFCSGNATLTKIKLTCTIDNGEFSFPVYYTKLAKSSPENRVPCFILINFRDDVPDRFLPSEEISDAGYAVLSFCYKDITSDDNDFTNGLAGILFPDGRKTPTDCGKIAMWAWAAIRVFDYANTLPELDHSHISVLGHSRLGKTALLAGAMDERFFCAFSNDSGCSGAALSRGIKGETIAIINERFPFWFCGNYKKYIDNEDALPFDQHYLIAANYPHRVYVASASKDLWADPENEYLSCIAASSYYENQGLQGFVHPEHMPEINDFLSDGYIGYHLRPGEHYLSRHDWNYYIKYINKHM